MKTQTKKGMSTETLVMGAILTALVFILQYVSMTVKISAVPITLVLIPVVIGAAYCGRGMGAWLGLVFGIAVLVTGASEPFFTINPIGTIITVIAKGTLCGLLAGIAYKSLENKNRYLAVLVAAIVCPIANTGIFFIGCILFFMPTIREWAGSQNVALYMFVGLAGINFLVEFGINLILNPTISRLLDALKKK